MSRDEPDLGDVFDELEDLEDVVDSPEERKQVEEVMQAAVEASQRGGSFGRVIRGFDSSDLTEAFLGSLLFGIPMAVEGGTQEIGAFLADHPLHLVATGLFPLALATGILYVAEFQDVRIYKPIFGIIPRRLVGVLGVSFLTALVMLTVWGRVSWAEPVVAVANVVVAFVPMTIGAALGDILPGS